MWSDPGVDWRAFDAVVVRSCWDYHLRPDAFRRWLDRVEQAEVRLWNPAPLVRGNLHKGYLLGLQEDGVPVAPTVVLPRGASASLPSLLDARGWDEAVLKPAVSASAYRTSRVARRDPGAQATLDALLAQCDVLVQGFLPEIAGLGEWSLVFLDGALSHAVLKRPRAGDFRVQEELGGRSTRQTPPAAVVEGAQDVVRRIPAPWLFARVDGIVRGGRFTLMELELVEPVLYFALEPSAAGRAAAAVLRAARR